MKLLFRIAFIVIFLLSATQNANAQILRKLQKRVEDKIEKEAERRTNKQIDKTVDDAFDKAEDSIDGKKKALNSDAKTVNNKNEPKAVKNVNATNQPSLNWAKYDFVPGDKIIFEDNLIGEENGEFPSRWDLHNGTIENAEFGGENVIMFRIMYSRIVPYLKNPKADYLPDVFTVEFDLFLSEGHFNVFFFDTKNQKHYQNRNLIIEEKRILLNPAISTIPDGGTIKKKWTHIAIAYTKGKMKVYINETRLINIPHLAFDPTGISLESSYHYDKSPIYIKNFRIAEGGVKYYEKFLQDGKIVTNGIRFDVNKAIIKPESMGVINSIYKILNDNPNLKFSVEGHTDSDGDKAFNQTLSENRAQSVMNRLAKMGISSNCLSFKGFGESKPIADNSSAEGKANNRRVEFVKQ
ncbi:MAG: OmpA family protein [Flavobacteriaceae bacterium]|nr:OmpA family protein [Flavobacteriaceae bacterium]